ncbi:hypothetical protein GCM10025862_21350 [Arsenicicoccus piscis]|uniref:DNA 5'-3' helicase n=1 Tax=Arsenicicoccus piscis TaxID=673954 RepID=A0ABQ6HR08_9MICO|nr:hypothetical protein GCM10025862_21350 [Arsenicicoccus piscis]
MPDLDALLDAAVGGIGGSARPGQVSMAQAVSKAISNHTHLLVQAGTGTGKSLAYLVPALQHAVDSDKPVIIATATLALQAQIVDRDLPRLAESVRALLGRKPTYALVKGRRNYVCLHKIDGGFPDDDEDSLMSVGTVDSGLGRLGAEVVRLRAWAEHTVSGDRDELVPGVSERAWRQVSVSAHECLGSKCPQVNDCFVERSRAAAGDVDIVVTNHSFMAIDSFEGRQMLPEHDVLVVDEAHELVDRVTSTVTDELSAGMISAAAKRSARLADSGALGESGDILAEVLENAPEGRITALPEMLVLALTRVRDAARAVQSELKPEKGAQEGGDAGPRQVARAAVDEVFDNAERMLEGRELDVIWLSQDPRRGPVLRVAPMSVAMLLRDKIFNQRTVVLTSATLELGGRSTRSREPSACAATAPRPGRGSTSAAPSTTRSRPSPTSRTTCRRPAATAWPTRRSTRSRRWCGPAGVGRSACSPPAGPPRRRPRRCASGSRPTAPTSRCSARVRTRSPRWCGSSPAVPRWRSSAPSPSGRAWTCPARPASSSSSTASRSRAPTTRSPAPAPRRSRGWAATASWRCPPRTPRSAWPRVQDGSSAARTTVAWWPSWTRG